MGSYVLYLLTQGFVAMIFAYFSGILAMQERKVHLLLVALGLYLLMGGSLCELWGDRVGWSPEKVAAFAALVAAGIGAIGTGCLHLELGGMRTSPWLRLIPYFVLIASVALAVALVALAGSTGVVDDAGAASLGPGRGYTRLGPVGWALGCPLFIGAALVILSGLRASLWREDGRGFWLVMAGVLFIIWPFDLGTEDLPFSPSLMIMAIAMTYFGFQPPKETEDGMATDEGDLDADVETKDGTAHDEGQEEKATPRDEGSGEPLSTKENMDGAGSPGTREDEAQAHTDEDAHGTDTPDTPGGGP